MWVIITTGYNELCNEFDEDLTRPGYMEVLAGIGSNKVTTCLANYIRNLVQTIQGTVKDTIG